MESEGTSLVNGEGAVRRGRQKGLQAEEIRAKVQDLTWWQESHQLGIV